MTGPGGVQTGTLRRVVAGRLVSLLLTVVLATLAAAVLVRVAPGFGTDERRLDFRLSRASRQVLEARAAGGSFWRDFTNYFAGLGHGDLGESSSLNRPVRDLVSERMGVTAANVGGGLALAWGLAMAAAIGLQMARARRFDLAAAVAAGALLCLPSAMLALIILNCGAGAAVALGAVLAPRLFRYLRNTLDAAGRQPHVLAARARGVGPPGILARHVWLPAAPEVAALAGVSVNMALGALIPAEALCDSPGLGQLVWQAALARDLPVLLNMTVLIAVVTAAANMVADLGRTAVAGGA